MRETSTHLQDYPLSPERASILAREIETLNRVVRDAARRICFEDEPANFSVVLEAAKKSRRTSGR